jgi:cell division septation protein DedD
VQQRIGKLTANVRREVEDELAGQRAEQEATAAAVEAREATVAARERKASLPTGQGSWR